MADETQKPTFVDKVMQAAGVRLDLMISKARSEIAENEDDAFWRKSVYRDINFNTGQQGYTERGTRIGVGHLKQMAFKDTIVASVIQTYQNLVAKHSKPVKEKAEIGFRIKRKHEEQELENIIEELFGKQDDVKAKAKKAIGKLNEEDEELDSQPGAAGPDAEENSAETAKVIGQGMAKADEDSGAEEPSDDDFSEEVPDAMETSEVEEDQEQPQPFGAKKKPEPKDLSDREKMRLAKEELRKRDRKKIEALKEFIENCGYLEDRPFESRRWDFEAFLRATVRDTLTYDLHATEIINDQKDDPHHFVPVDGSTIRLTTPEFSQYQNQDLSSGYDILYPEKELEALKEDSDAFVLDPEKVEEGDYKFAQVVRGRVERAFTPEELAVGMRNPTTDIYANGYSISELELLVGAVSSHIFTENYNHSYYTQGFSAKGVLHIKAPMNRRKLESVRTQWKAMVSGNRNSFQTPIFAGMDEVQWIPLTQNHADMEFSNWMNYLIKIICSIYQIDPAEIGFGMREEGGGGGSSGQTGTNTEAKLANSRNKGLKPLLRHIEAYINKHILSRIDDDFVLEFTGITDESQDQTVERQSKEVKFKKSVNDIREEDGLAPIEGADDLILDPTFFQWFSQFHPEGQKLAAKNAAAGMPPGGGPPGAGGPPGMPGAAQPGDEQANPEEQPEEEWNMNENEPPPVPLSKSLRAKKKGPIVIEYYRG